MPETHRLTDRYASGLVEAGEEHKGQFSLADAHGKTEFFRHYVLLPAHSFG